MDNIGSDGKIGSGGTYKLAVSDKGIARAELAYAEGFGKGGAFVEVDIVVALEEMAKSTGNKIDDSVVAMIKGMLGR